MGSFFNRWKKVYVRIEAFLNFKQFNKTLTTTSLYNVKHVRIQTTMPGGQTHPEILTTKSVSFSIIYERENNIVFYRGCMVSNASNKGIFHIERGPI